MRLLAYIVNRSRERKVLGICHRISQEDQHRDKEERREVDPRLEQRFREEILRYEDDLRELAKT